MPQNKPMKIQWITVNGRQVPLVLPQTYSYEIEDWKVTSDRDPLPVVEYGTTAGGIVVPKRVSDEGHELTQLTGSNVIEELASGVVVPANSHVDINSTLSFEEIRKFSTFVLTGRSDASHPYQVSVLWESTPRSDISGFRVREYISDSNTSIISPTIVDIKTVREDRFQFRIENNSDSVRTYNLEVYWRV